MIIRNANTDDITYITEIYSEAKVFMRASGNKDQWTGTYPQRSLIERDIANRNCFVCEENGEILGVFCLFDGPDPTYSKIYNGNWPNEDDYCVIHRIAVKKHGKGIAEKCYEFGLDKKGVLRIDTHRDNLPMRRSLAKNGFLECGIIYLESGDERIAFYKDKKLKMH